MLTPAEELGLSGLALASRVRKAFFNIPEPRLRELLQRVRAEAARRHLSYLRDGQLETIPVFACPMTVLPDQLAYLHFVTQTIHNALKRLPDLYLEDCAVREVLRLTPEEDAWLVESWGPELRDNAPVFGRLDAMVDFISPMWKDTLRFVEPNLSGIGGLHLVPTAERIVADVVLPALRECDGALRLHVGADIRQLLMQEVLDHLETLRRPARHLCFIEPKYAGSGPDEQDALAIHFHEQYRIKVTHADPSELIQVGDEVYYDGAAIDLAYRDYPVADLVELQRQGIDVGPMRTLFRQNRVISSIAAEMDQKSCWEILTDPQFTRKYFSADERQLFRRHILWTRLVAPRSTTFPDGDSGDLLTYIRDERETLVLKPNRAFGGAGVVLGPSVDQPTWDAAIERALADPERWVVQQLANIPVSVFPVLGPDGAIHFEPFYTVMGFAPSKYGVAILGRGSQKQVVNVAQRGGICVLLIGQPPGPLHGPG